MRPAVDVVIPTIPPHVDCGLFRRAAESVGGQHYDGPVTVVHFVDHDHEGAAATRNRLLDWVGTDWVAFLDSDDLLYPDHLRLCMDFADALRADVVYPGYDVDGGEDPVGLFGHPFNPDWLAKTNFIPVTVVARTELVRAAGGFIPHPDEHGDPCEDWGLWLAMLGLGARFAHLPERTWRWTVGEHTTRGRGDRW